MKYDVKNRFSGKVQFTAEINCSDKHSSVALGLTVKLAIKNKANLSCADLSEADLSGADFSGTDLSYTDFSGADLSGAKFSGADLSYTDFSGADLSYTDFSGADLSEADLSGADLNEADLIVIQSHPWTAYIQKTHTRIGCKYYTNKEWLEFSDNAITKMDSRALQYWNTNKSSIRDAIVSLQDESK